MSKPGHNSKVQAGPIQADRLKSFIERIEKLNEEVKAVQGDVKDVYSEAKGVGYDVATMRKIVAIRAKDMADVAEQETLLDVYKHALGMDTIGYGGAAREPTEEELEERAGRIADEVDRCMALVRDSRLPKIEDIKRLIGCSNGKAQKLRGMIATRLEQFSRLLPSTRENENPATHSGISQGDAERSCGGGEQRPGDVGLTAEQQHGASRAERAVPENAPAGVAPGPHDTDPPCVMCFQAGSHGPHCPANEAPATPSVGAVASESERVASSVLTPHVTTDDDLTIPAHLRGPSPANRRVA